MQPDEIDEDDPFYAIIGMIEGDESPESPTDDIDEVVYGDPHGLARRQLTDLSVNYKHYLYGWPEKGPDGRTPLA